MKNYLILCACLGLFSDLKPLTKPLDFQRSLLILAQYLVGKVYHFNNNKYIFRITKVKVENYLIKFVIERLCLALIGRRLLYSFHCLLLINSILLIYKISEAIQHKMKSLITHTLYYLNVHILYNL